MGGSSPSIIMSFASLGSYRLNTMRGVKAHFGDQIEIYSGDKAPDPSIRLIGEFDLDHRRVKNYILGGSVVLQKIPFMRFLQCRLLVMDLNPRMPLVWILLIVRRILRRRTLLWGHAFPRAGRNSRTERVRAAMRNLSSGIIAYTRTQSSELAELHRDIPVWSAPNALYPQADFFFDANSRRDSFLYVGRLHPDKKPLLMIEAFEKFWKHHPDIRLVVVGDGPLSDEVQRRASGSSASGAIEVLGHIDKYERLRDLYSRAIASLSPGYVGLSVTQSLSFGVPMIISRDEPHAPEIEAVQRNFNGFFFTTDDAESLAQAMSDLTSRADTMRTRGTQIAESCAENYSVEAMVSGLVDALEDKTP